MTASWRASLILAGLILAAPAMAQEMSPAEIRARIDAQIRAHDQADPGARQLWLNNGQDYNKPLYPSDASANPQKPASPPQANAPEPLTFRSIQFGYDSDKLTQGSLLTIGGIALVLSLPDYAKNIFVIVGHTDSRGEDGYNLQLSGRRAMSVVAALRTAGVPAERLRAAGMGERKPVYGLSSDDPANRRVEVALFQ